MSVPPPMPRGLSLHGDGMTPDLTFVERPHPRVITNDIWEASCGYFHFVIGFADESPTEGRGNGSYASYEAIYWIRDGKPHLVGFFESLDEAKSSCEVLLLALVKGRPP